MTGAAAVTLSMRSSTPPWPGTAAAVLEARVALEHALGQVADHREGRRRQAQRHEGAARRSWNQTLPPKAHGSASSMPPSTPSQVLSGETCGASFTRPKARPAK